MIKTYIKKPLAIQAVQWTGDNTDEIIEFGGIQMSDSCKSYWVIHTLEGHMEISIGDYVIRGTSGEYYPCKPDIFERIYEEQDEQNDMTYEEALEKQISKRPKIKKEGFKSVSYDCPICENYLVSEIDNELVAGQKYNYCHKCGQRLDWSDIK